MAPGRSILHVDMDAFFVAVELLDQPELIGKPVVVGGTGPRGVVAAASYEARAYGVHSALASSIARQRCPHAVFLNGRHSRYREVSAQVMEVFQSFTPWVEPLSLDEAFLDVSGSLRLFGSPVEVAASIRSRVLEEVGISCSVGVAPNKFLAKLASVEAKPTASRTGPVAGPGVVLVAEDQIQAFLDPLPVERIWGVGPATLGRLQRIGIRSIADLRLLPLDTLRQVVGAAAAERLAALSRGEDERAVSAHSKAKSISHEETFPTDRHSTAELRGVLVRLADAVASRLRQSSVAAKTISLKLRFSSFQLITRSTTLQVPTADTSVILDVVLQALEGVDVSEGVRLVGIGASGLSVHEEVNEQLGLFGEHGQSVENRDGLNAAVDAIRGRFGSSVIGFAASMDAGSSVSVHQEGQQQWGPVERTEPPTISKQRRK